MNGSDTTKDREVLPRCTGIALLSKTSGGHSNKFVVRPLPDMEKVGTDRSEHAEVIKQAIEAGAIGSYKP